MPAHERLKAKRLEAKMTLEQLERKIRHRLPGLDTSDLSKIERGERVMKADEVPILAWAVGCKTEALHDPQPTEPPDESL